MNGVIDLGSELLLDQSVLSDPYVRLLAAALGETLAEGSPWVAIDRHSAALWGLTRGDTQPPSNARAVSDDVVFHQRRSLRPSRFGQRDHVRARQPAGQEPGWPARLQTTSGKS
jgi:hypothetical protein